MLRFHFPIVIIDEDYRSENTSGLGIRALAQAIEIEPRLRQARERQWRQCDQGQAAPHASAPQPVTAHL